MVANIYMPGNEEHSMKLKQISENLELHLIDMIIYSGVLFFET